MTAIGFHMGWRRQCRGYREHRFWLTTMITCHQIQCQTVSGIIVRNDPRQGERDHNALAFDHIGMFLAIEDDKGQSSRQLM